MNEPVKRPARAWPWARRGVVPVAVLLASLMLLPAHAQKVAPRQTGAMVVQALGQAREAVLKRAMSADKDGLRHVAGQLQKLEQSLVRQLGSDSNAPLQTIDEDVRASVLRADAATHRVRAMLEAAGVSCTREEVQAMVQVLATTLDELAKQDDAQSKPMPMIRNVRSLDGKPLFAVHQGAGGIPKFILEGVNLVDSQCPNPTIEAVDLKGKPVKAQPQVVAAQPTRVEVQWPGVVTLAPGSYVLRLTAQHKRFLLGCGDEPTTLAVLGILPSPSYTVSYVIDAECGRAGQPLQLAAGTLPTLDASHPRVSQPLVSQACPNATGYAIRATVRTADGQESRFGPVHTDAGVTMTVGLGHGLTLQWDPYQQRLDVQTGQSSCSGVH